MFVEGGPHSTNSLPLGLLGCDDDLMKSGDVLGGKYRLVQQIGEGAMGTVWSGENLSTGRKVALKLIQPAANPLRTNDLRERLMREARACGKLSHRNIVHLYDVSETPEGDPFLVMELLHGQTLGEMLKDKRRIEPSVAARIGADVASALAVAHAANVIHRDLKPANIFLHREAGMGDEAFVVKVVDFGVAKNLDATGDLATQTGAVVGSPAYMSPEQVGLRKDLDRRTDIWSLGIVLYEMLTGVRPFTGSLEEVVRQVLLAPIHAPSSRVRNVTPEFDEVIARCLDRNREKRFANASELSWALMGIAERSGSARYQLAVGGPPASGPQRQGPVTQPGPGALDPATGTQLLSPNAPIVSPTPPAWRQEMNEALAVRRQSSSTLQAVKADEVLHGSTQMLGSEVVAQATAGMDRSTTTSTGAISTDPRVNVNASSPMVPLELAGARPGRKRGSMLVAGIVAAGALGLIGTVLVFLLLDVSGQKGAAGTKGEMGALPQEAKVLQEQPVAPAEVGGKAEGVPAPAPAGAGSTPGEAVAAAPVKPQAPVAAGTHKPAVVAPGKPPQPKCVSTFLKKCPGGR
jgi:eukaryotic-like serine/threonine-protein kinase